jgi:hypothetical protein
MSKRDGNISNQQLAHMCYEVRDELIKEMAGWINQTREGMEKFGSTLYDLSYDERHEVENSIREVTYAIKDVEKASVIEGELPEEYLLRIKELLGGRASLGAVKWRIKSVENLIQKGKLGTW